MNRISYSKIHELLGQGIKNFSGMFISPNKNKDEWFGFFGQDLTNVDFSHSTINFPKFNSATLIETSFFGASFYLNNDINIFQEVKEIKDVDFRGAKFYLESNNSDDISLPPNEIDIKNILSPKQYDNVIKTDEEYKKFLKRKNQEQKTQLESTSKKQINSLVEGFENLEKEYYFEEKFWMRIISIIAFFLIFLVFLPFLLKIFPHPYIVILPIIFFLGIFLLFINLINKKEDSIKACFSSLNFLKQSFEELKSKLKDCWLILDNIQFWSVIKSIAKASLLPFMILFLIVFKIIDNIINCFLFLWKYKYSIGLYFLIIIILLPFIFNIIENKLWKKVTNLDGINLDNLGNIYYLISPIIILFITLLYFSVTQYSKSKKLRIDNQNKIALIHGMMAIKSDTTNMEKGRFYDKVAEIVFDKVHHGKEENLPIDKIIQIIKATNGQK